ncbi:SdrD B-like domain-containing protein [Labedaea rhizosphaerae]|uniref:SdrD B-like protein n=1 Tax=Labedaea rhizosphaerae TaxID=598644 RepID=A0A4R6SM30_LABRH|nr:SdrD B-like domain-containing protein [Labedaea rhizosphaerae]TDQ04954.1 SdrD B-like protein [Labedaea rhizosphaerae]
MTRARIVASISALALLLGSAPAYADDPTFPTVPTIPPAGSGFSFSATLDKAAYHFGEPIKVHVEVANTGTEPVSMAVDVDGDLSFDTAQWDGLIDGTSIGVVLAAGERKVLDVTADVTFPHSDTTSFTETLDAFNNFSSDGPHKRVTLTAPISALTGVYSGTAYFDANANATMDPGEQALPGVTVHIVGGPPYTEESQVTDAQGHFSFTVPIGNYTASYRMDGGYVPIVREDSFYLDEAGRENQFVAFKRPLSDRLHATMKLTKSTYKVGEVAHATVKLTNSGNAELTGVKAVCDRGGFQNELNPSKPGHGPLAVDGAGVTLAAGQTRTFDVYDTVPAGAREDGYVSVSCDFGPDADVDGRATAHDQARVPGQRGSGRGQLLYDRNGDGTWDQETEGVSGVKVVLRDQFSHKIIGRATSDKRGFVNFADLPSGRHEVEVVGRWQPVSGALTLEIKNPPRIYPQPLRIKPGPNHPDPQTTTAPAPGTGGGTTPTPQGSAGAHGLAYTGVDVFPPLFGGVLLLAAGAALVLATRRWRTA